MELRYTSNGKAVANFSLAINETFKNGDGAQREHVEWVRCVAWGRLAEVCGEFLTKGKQACAEGRFQTRKYNDRDGNERTVCGSTFSLASRDSRSVLAVKGPLRRFAPWTVTTLRFRLGLDAAEAWWLQIDGSTRLRIESIDEARGERARALFFRYRDKDFIFYRLL